MLKKPAIWAEIGEIDGFIAIFIRLHDHSGLWCGRADHTNHSYFICGVVPQPQPQPQPQ